MIVIAVEELRFPVSYPCSATFHADAGFSERISQVSQGPGAVLESNREVLHPRVTSGSLRIGQLHELAMKHW